MIRLARLTLLIALMLSIGGHWALIQTAAWTGMIVKYSRDASLSVAIAKTFDGRHPCALCRLVDGAEKTPAPAKPASPGKDLQFKLDCFVETEVNPPVVFASSSRLSEKGSRQAFARAERPRTPPPRLG